MVRLIFYMREEFGLYKLIQKSIMIFIVATDAEVKHTIK